MNIYFHINIVHAVWISQRENEQKKIGWDKSNQKVHRGINVFSVKTCMRQSFEMGFFKNTFY